MLSIKSIYIIHMKDYDNQDKQENQPTPPAAPKKAPFVSKPADSDNRRSLTTSTDYESRHAWKAFMSRHDPLELWLLI